MYSFLKVSKMLTFEMSNSKDQKAYCEAQLEGNKIAWEVVVQCNCPVEGSLLAKHCPCSMNIAHRKASKVARHQEEPEECKPCWSIAAAPAHQLGKHSWAPAAALGPCSPSLVGDTDLELD